MRRRNAETTPGQRRVARACLRFGLLLLLVLGPSAAFAGPFTVPNSFTNGQLADANEVNENFDAVKTEVDDNDARITTLLGQSCPAGEVVSGIDAGGSLVCTPAPPVDPTCPAGTNSRTPAQVLQDLHAAIAALDWVAFGCTYDLNALTINDAGVDLGRADIVAFETAKTAFFGVGPTVTSEIITDNLARELYTQANATLAIADGVKSYVIENGQIQRSTDHGVLTTP